MTGERLTEDEVAERGGDSRPNPTARPDGHPGAGGRDLSAARRAASALRPGLESIGVDAAAVADALASGDLTLGYVEIGAASTRSDRTLPR